MLCLIIGMFWVWISDIFLKSMYSSRNWSQEMAKRSSMFGEHYQILILKLRVISKMLACWWWWGSSPKSPIFMPTSENLILHQAFLKGEAFYEFIIHALWCLFFLEIFGLVLSPKIISRLSKIFNRIQENPQFIIECCPSTTLKF